MTFDLKSVINTIGAIGAISNSFINKYYNKDNENKIKNEEENKRTSTQQKVNNVFSINKTDKNNAFEENKKTGLQQVVNNVFGITETNKNNVYNPFYKKREYENISPLYYKEILEKLEASKKPIKYVSPYETYANVFSKNRQQTKKENYDPSFKKSPPSTQGIGFISAKYESGGNGGTVSSGQGDAGGVSYGISQFSSKTGSADKFVSWLKQANPDMASAFGNYKAGTTNFSNAWKQTFSNYGEAFTKVQQQYTYENYVKPLAELAKKKTGIDYTRSTALLELLYSTAIQFGAGSLGLSALGKVSADMSDEDIINASYDNKIANYKSYFKSSSSAVQESVKNRFKNERQDVLRLLK